MKTSKHKKGLSLILALIMVITMIPATIFTISAQDYPLMKSYNAASMGDYHSTAYCGKVYSVTFLDHIDYDAISSSDTVASWDVSDAGDGSVMAWAKTNEVETAAANGTARYDIYIGGDGGVQAHENTTHLFYAFSSLEEVKGLENFKTNKVKKFEHWFASCSSLENIDLSALDTSSATSLKNMFRICQKLLYVNLDSFDTSNVTDMSYMFWNCNALKEVDLRNFDTSKVTTMLFMFYRCLSLKNIFVGSGWTNESIANINESVFNCCYAVRGGEDEYYKNPQESAYYATAKPEGNLELRYKVEYEFTGDVPEGVTPPAKSYYEKNETASVENTPTAPEGYIFEGWTTDSDTPVSGEFTVTNDVVYTGEWTKLYNVNYVYIGDVPAGAPGLNSYQFKAGETVTVDSAPYVDGYVFVGWSCDDVATTDGTFTMPAADVTLYGYFKVPVTGVVISTGNVTLNEGDETKITVTVNPEDATIKDLVYESSDKNVVTVDEDGNITAVGEGTATITVSSKDDPTKSDTITVTVKKPVTEVSIEEEKIIIYIGDEPTKVDVTVSPDGATNKELIWESGDDSVVTVDENGNITPVGEGTTTVTVTSKDDPTKSDTVIVKVKIPVDDVVIKNEDTVLNVNESTQLVVVVNPDTASVKELEYTSSNESVVTVDEEGNITAVGEGTATITVTSKDDPTKSDTITITVKNPVESITPDKSEVTLDVGKTDQIKVTVTPDNATEKGVTFESSDKNVVIVDEEGNITAVGEGTATITITSKDNPTKFVTVTVKIEKAEEPDVPDEPDEPEYVIEVPDSINIYVGENKEIGVKVTPSEGYPKPTYTSADPSIATVDADGYVRGLRAGTTTITVDFGNGEIRVIPVVVLSVPTPPRTHYICFGKTDGIGWYEVSVNGGDFFPQGPNSTLEVEEGSVIVVRTQDMWIDDEFDFYVNGKKVPCDPANTITLVVDGYMLIGALSMDVEVPDVEESLNIFQRIAKAFKDFFDWIASLFKKI